VFVHLIDEFAQRLSEHSEKENGRELLEHRYWAIYLNANATVKVSKWAQKFLYIRVL
jgi:hypothetical protein